MSCWRGDQQCGQHDDAENKWQPPLRYRHLPLPNPLRAGPLPLERQGDQLLIACGGSKTVSVTVQTPSADCSCSDAGTVGVEIYSISADDTRGVAVAVIISVYALVAERACRSAVAVTISVLVLTANPAGSIAVSISIGVHAAAVLGAGRVSPAYRRSSRCFLMRPAKFITNTSHVVPKDG
jgi:hypothetical protein